MGAAPSTPPCPSEAKQLKTLKHISASKLAESRRKERATRRELREAQARVTALQGKLRKCAEARKYYHNILNMPSAPTHSVPSTR
jgi:hypothetical protein